MSEQVAQGLDAQVLKEHGPTGTDSLQVLDGGAKSLFGQLARVRVGLLESTHVI